MPYFLIGRRSVIRGGVSLWEKDQNGGGTRESRESCGSSPGEGERTRAHSLSIEWVLNKPPFSFALAFIDLCSLFLFCSRDGHAFRKTKNLTKRN